MHYNPFSTYLPQLLAGQPKATARCISLVENEAIAYQQFMQQLPTTTAPIIGITGPPGAGKSTLTDALIGQLVKEGRKVAVLCIDPSSPFNYGALLGDRIRMNQWYTHPQVFIRSLATRGALGGMHPKTIEIADILKAAGYHYIIIETVGVGQSEIEIAGLADCTIVVMVPEAGDEVQTMKAGLMEIADVFVVNKADRPGADMFVKNLRQMMAPAFSSKPVEIPILKTIASQKEGIAELAEAIKKCLSILQTNPKKYWLLAERAYQLIQANKMAGIDKQKLMQAIAAAGNTFNLYQFSSQYF